MPFGKCPVCGGELVKKQVEKLLRGGNHTAVVAVEADVCLRCGERLYDQLMVKRFEDIRAKLRRGDISQFRPLGRSFEVS